jgi:peroxiredoxin Q/BCP
MAQLRQDHDQYVQRNLEVVVIGPEDGPAFADYWRREALPFVGLPDPGHGVLRLYGQQTSLFKLGRLPAQVLVDVDGIARYVHYGHDMSDIPSTAEILAQVDQLAYGRSRRTSGK